MEIGVNYNWHPEEMHGNKNEDIREIPLETYAVT